MSFPSNESSAAPPSRGAWLFTDAVRGSRRVAALSLLDRALVAVHRAGFAPIRVVCDGPLPPVPRARAWRVPFTVVKSWEPTADPALVIGPDVLVAVGDLRSLKPGEVLVDGRGAPLPIRLLDANAPDPWGDSPVLSPICATGVSLRVRDAAEAGEAARALWSSITSSSDGFVDRWFNRPVGRPLSRLLVHTPVTPNQISVSATLLGLVAAGLFAVGDPRLSIVAAVVFQLSAVLDCVDGDVARVAFKESPLGKWLDIVGDQVVHIGVFLGIAAGLVRTGVGQVHAWLGAAAAVGAALSFLVFLRGTRQQRAGEDGHLQRLLDAATSRDFSVLVLILAVADRLQWFLWLAAAGSHVFWMLLLALQLRAKGRP